MRLHLKKLLTNNTYLNRMKKLLAFSIFAVSLFVFPSFGQSGLGIKGGVNLTTISTDAGSFKNNIVESYANRTGFVFGIYGRIGDKLYLQPEVMVASKGGEISINNQNYKVKYTDLDIPLLVGFKVIKTFRIMAGPVASIKVSEDETLRNALKNVTGNPDDAFANASFGYQAGVGLKLMGLDLELRRQGSLTDVSAQIPNEPKFSQRASGWQFTVGIKIL